MGKVNVQELFGNQSDESKSNSNLGELLKYLNNQNAANKIIQREKDIKEKISELKTLIDKNENKFKKLAKGGIKHLNLQETEINSTDYNYDYKIDIMANAIKLLNNYKGLNYECDQYWNYIHHGKGDSDTIGYTCLVVYWSDEKPNTKWRFVIRPIDLKSNL